MHPTSDQLKAAEEAIKKYLVLPVNCDDFGMYIFDAASNMVADTHEQENGVALQVRGWGRLGKLGQEEGAKAQKEIGDAFALAFNFVFNGGLSSLLSDREAKAREEERNDLLASINP